MQKPTFREPPLRDLDEATFGSLAHLLTRLTRYTLTGQILCSNVKVSRTQNKSRTQHSISGQWSLGIWRCDLGSRYATRQEAPRETDSGSTARLHLRGERETNQDRLHLEIATWSRPGNYYLWDHLQPKGGGPHDGKSPHLGDSY